MHPFKIVRNLGIGYIISYGFFLGVPIFALVCMNKTGDYIGCVFYSAMVIAIKIAMIVVLVVEAWRHYGKCYI